jgi:hypothetical protein
MPLDKPTVPAFIHTKEELDGHGPMHWVGCNGDWVAFVQQDGHLTIRNIYISDTIIPLPSLQDAGISLGPTSEWWHGSPPFLFKYKIDKSLELLKVRIVKRPYKDDLAGPWHYEVIVVFDELIAILQAPLEKEWNILRNPEFFDRNSYVDAMGIPGYGTSSHLHRVYAVTYPYGDVLVWEPYTCGESLFYVLTSKWHAAHVGPITIHNTDVSCVLNVVQTFNTTNNLVIPSK